MEIGAGELGSFGSFGSFGSRGAGEQGSRGAGEQGSRGARGKQMGVKAHTDLEVYRLAFDTAMVVFEQSKRFPAEERYALTDQVRRSARSVCANVGEAWRKRRYQAAFIAKLSDAEAEAAETQIWIEFAVRCHYLDRDMGASLYQTYDQIIGKLVTMIHNPSPWLL